MSLAAKTNIFIAGHNGMVGSAIMRQLKQSSANHLIIATRSELDLTNQQAVNDFSKSIPKLLVANSANKGSYSTRQRFKLIIETYIDLLALIHGSHLEQELNLKAADEAFRLADAVRGQVVQRALGASGARVAVRNPVLADLVRKEQDSHQLVRPGKNGFICALFPPRFRKCARSCMDRQAVSLKNRYRRWLKKRDVSADEQDLQNFSIPQTHSVCYT